MKRIRRIKRRQPSAGSELEIDEFMLQPAADREQDPNETEGRRTCGPAGRPKPCEHHFLARHPNERNRRRQRKDGAVVPMDAAPSLEAGHRLKDVRGSAKIGRPEENPAAEHEERGQRPADGAWKTPTAPCPGAVESERDAMKAAPRDERPVGAVPEATEQHR